jgi:hypothetical protein
VITSAKTKSDNKHRKRRNQKAKGESFFIFHLPFVICHWWNRVSSMANEK